ncbi:MAG: exonuclease SbcCD subunit D C-terminal domain-containing protein, partial [Mailhella sp.]
TRENVETLIIAGDIFDSALPGNTPQAMYYRFLRSVTAQSSPCRHVIIIAGNHDSPAFLDAPAGLLSSMDIHVIGAARSPEKETLLLSDREGNPELIVCAVPFLRDRDLYTAKDKDTPLDREQRMAKGMKLHYEQAAEAAEKLRAGRNIPILATGHLFAAGSIVSGKEKVGELEIGSLGKVEAEVFPCTFCYVALGHLHAAQKVHGEERLRYTGSPLPMGFDEAARTHEVRLIRTEGSAVSSYGIPVPSFQRLEHIEGSIQEIEERLHELQQSAQNIWVEVLYTGQNHVPDLRERIEACRTGNLDILRVRSARMLAKGFDADPEENSLEELSPYQVFEKLISEAFPEGSSSLCSLDELRSAFLEAEHSANYGSDK